MKMMNVKHTIKPARKVFNKGLLFSLAISAALFVDAQFAGAKAETVFMVQLGAFDSEKKAAAHWQSLVSTFPDLFDNLNYSPNEVVMKPENFVSYRTQAGPIPTRDEAEGICAALIRSGYECGVSETAMFYGGDKEITQSGNEAVVAAPAIALPIAALAAVPAVVAPVVAAPVVSAPVAVMPMVAAPAAPAVGTPVIVPFAPQSAYVAPQVNKATSQPRIMGSAPQNLNAGFGAGFGATQAVPDAPVATAPSVQGTIAAEEAIPVPLSNNAAIVNPYLEKGNRLMEAHPSDNSQVNSYWADISFFSNNIAAAQYVKALKMRDSLLPAQLRIRITRPYGVVTGNERLSLRMGPFVTTRPIMRLCALTRQDNLRCRAVKDIGGSVRNSDRYSNRRGAARAVTNYAGYRGSVNQPSRSQNNVSQFGGRNFNGRSIGGQGGATQNMVVAARGQMNNNVYSNVGNEGGVAGNYSGSYYVQLGSFLSPAAADAKWTELQNRHGSALSGVKNDVVMPNQGSSASRLFRLRAGPFADMNGAYSLCGQLKAQGTLCIVVK